MREQRAGICPRCPLSPFLFVTVMSLLLTDARRSMARQGLNVKDLVYADETLIVAEDKNSASAYIRPSQTLALALASLTTGGN